MKITKVLIVTQEVQPYLTDSEISKSTTDLLSGLQSNGREIRTFMPRYGIVNERRHQLHEVIRLSGMNLIIDDTDHLLIIKVASIPQTRVQVYFIDNEDFFQVRGITASEDGKEYADNDERAIFFARGVIETVKKLRWVPDVVHCHGWITSLVPLYMKKNYADDPSFRDAKVVYSAYADKFVENLDSRFVDKLEMDGIDISDLGVEKGEALSHDELIKLATRFSDGVISASLDVTFDLEGYAKEIGKKVLVPTPENFVAESNSFYDEVCE